MLQHRGAPTKTLATACPPLNCTVHQSSRPCIFQQSTPHARAAATCMSGSRPRVSVMTTAKPPSHHGNGLKEGSMITLGGQTFRLQHHLGSGSFGRVWSASCPSYASEVAIKEICCVSQQRLAEAENEVNRLRMLAGSGIKQVPALLATQTFQIGPSTWQVVLAMQRVPGEELHKFSEKQKAPLEVKHLDTQFRLFESGRFVASMLWQIAHIFTKMSPYMIHRDAHLRNMLVDSGHGPCAKFGLVDFGFAVDASSWKQGDWQKELVSGDCRYWPTSSWFLFCRGPKEFSAQPHLRREYESYLDFHSVGLSGLQLFVNMMSPLLGSSAEKASASSPVMSALRKLHAAWQKYWSDSSHFQSLILDASSGKRNVNDVRKYCLSKNVAAIFTRNLKSLRASLLEMRDACFEKVLVDVMDALLLLISSGDGRSPPPSWESIQSKVQLVGADDTCMPSTSHVERTSTTRTIARSSFTSGSSFEDCNSLDCDCIETAVLQPSLRLNVASPAEFPSAKIMETDGQRLQEVEFPGEFLLLSAAETDSTTASPCSQDTRTVQTVDFPSDFLLLFSAAETDTSSPGEEQSHLVYCHCDQPHDEHLLSSSSTSCPAVTAEMDMAIPHVALEDPPETSVATLARETPAAATTIAHLASLSRHLAALCNLFCVRGRQT